MEDKPKRSMPELIIALCAVLGLLVAVLTGIRAFYVNEYRVDLLEATVKEVRADIKEARSDVKELYGSVQRLLGAAEKNGQTLDRISKEPHK